MKILFWSEDHRPQDFVDPIISQERREAVAEILKAGKVLASYRGFARCRMCRQILGSSDLGAHGFHWPEGAEHYVLKHRVWVPELDLLLSAKERRRA